MCPNCWPPSLGTGPDLCALFCHTCLFLFSVQYSFINGLVSFCYFSHFFLPFKFETSPYSIWKVWATWNMLWQKKKKCPMFTHLICHRWWTAVNPPHRPLILAVICPFKNRWSTPKSHRTWSLTSGCANLALNVVQWPTYHFLLRRSFLPQTFTVWKSSSSSSSSSVWFNKSRIQTEISSRFPPQSADFLHQIFKMKNTHGVLYPRKVTILQIYSLLLGDKKHSG